MSQQNSSKVFSKRIAWVFFSFAFIVFPLTAYSAPPVILRGPAQVDPRAVPNYVQRLECNVIEGFEFVCGSGGETRPDVKTGGWITPSACLSQCKMDCSSSPDDDGYSGYPNYRPDDDDISEYAEIYRRRCKDVKNYIDLCGNITSDACRKKLGINAQCFIGLAEPPLPCLSRPPIPPAPSR